MRYVLSNSKAAPSASLRLILNLALYLALSLSLLGSLLGSNSFAADVKKSSQSKQSDQTDRNKQTVKLSGWVYDDAQPLRGATVSVYSHDKKITSGACDSNGRFTIRWRASLGALNLPNLVLRANFAGYYPYEYSLQALPELDQIVISLTPTLASLDQTSDKTSSLHPDNININGVISDATGEALYGATVELYQGERFLTGIACDTAGEFEFSWTASSNNTESDTGAVGLKCSSVGFESASVLLVNCTQIEGLEISLAESTIELATITVQAPREQAETTQHDNSDLTTAAQRSVLSSNPLEVVRGAEVSRSGSAFGSQIRFSGSNPDHTLNGVSLGSDPAHYGMFALLPSASVARLTFTDQTLSASAGSASAVELETDRKFSETQGGSMGLSVLEALSAYRFGTEKMFVSGSLRESTLDKVVRMSNIERERSTIPPTSYRDMFLSAGYRFAGGTDLFVDQLFARDALEYNTQSSSVNTAGVETYQHTYRQNSALSLRHSTKDAIFNARFSYQEFISDYRASALDASNIDALKLDLSEQGSRIQTSADYTLERGTKQYTFGANFSKRMNPDVSLEQRNWNFLPPQSTSDNPHYYQLALNETLGSLQLNEQTQEVAVFADYAQRWDSWRVQTGLRLQHNNFLSVRRDALVRFSVSHRLDDQQNIQLSLGTYAESPIKNLIDPNQILIRRDLAKLKNEKTRLVKLSYSKSGEMNRELTVSMFAKQLRDLASLTPTYRDSDLEGEQQYFLTDLSMTSERNQTITGFTFSYSDPAVFSELFDSRLDLRASYAFTHSSETTHGIASRVVEDTPHRIEFDLGFDAGKNYDLGLQLFARSGYRYTDPSAPTGPLMNTATSENELDYYSALALQNSERFPVNLNLNISARRKIGDLTVFMNVGNLFNRANPLVRTLDGFVYDAGVLPSFGATYSF